jgi:hypothetical protein
MSLDRRRSFIAGGPPADQRRCHRRMLRYGPFWGRSHLIRLATVQPRKTTIQWITLPLSWIHMLLFPMFAASRPFFIAEFHLSARPLLPVQFLLSPFTSIACRLLALFLMALSFVFSNLQPLLPKQGGIGGYNSIWQSNLLAACFHNLLALCIHNVTNTSSRNPFLFTSIQIALGVPHP